MAGSSSRPESRSSAARPALAPGRATVVRAGLPIEAKAMPSLPTTLSPPGTSVPRAALAWIPLIREGKKGLAVSGTTMPTLAVFPVVRVRAALLGR